MLNNRHSIEFKTLEFIARNVIYPDRPSPGGNYVSLENMMTRLGGQTRILKK